MFGISKTKKIFFTTAVLAVFVLTPLLLLDMISEHHHGGIPMNDCPMMIGETAICKMSAVEHLLIWQSMFIALPTQVISFVLLAFSLLIFYKLRSLFATLTFSTKRFLNKLLFSRYFFGNLFLFSSTINPRAP